MNVNLDWPFMCAFDAIEYDENTFERIIDVSNTPTTIRGIADFNRNVNVFFKETNIIRAHDQLKKIIDNPAFPYEKLVPHVIEQIQTFTFRNCPIHTMQQRQIGLDLFCFWPNSGNAPKFTLENFKTWIFTLSILFDAFVQESTYAYNSPPFLVIKLDILHDKLLLIEENKIELSELYVFNMATAVFDFITEMAIWASTSVKPYEASLDRIKLLFRELEHNFDLVASNHQGIILPFIAHTNTIMNFYKHDY
jgi:hypothetical protein